MIIVDKTKHSLAKSRDVSFTALRCLSSHEAWVTACHERWRSFAALTYISARGSPLCLGCACRCWRRWRGRGARDRRRRGSTSSPKFTLRADELHSRGAEFPPTSTLLGRDVCLLRAEEPRGLCRGEAHLPFRYHLEHAYTLLKNETFDTRRTEFPLCSQLSFRELFLRHFIG